MWYISFGFKFKTTKTTKPISKKINAWKTETRYWLTFNAYTQNRQFTDHHQIAS